MSVLSAKSDEPIPGYKVKSRLGAGGYGEVWTCEAPGQLLKAIKFVYGMLDEDRAARELKALNRIKGVRHPFLLSLERIEVVDGHLLIITELADGSLKDCYEQFRKAGDPGIPRDELLNHVRDAADALDYMSDRHSLQHLDVKPENLLLVGGRIKVADFGLVKDIQDATASMMGGLTPVYAPPEVFEGSPSRRSDQYSLAIVFQEMLTGVLPFPGKTAAQLAAQHLNAKPRLAALPAADQPVIARALAKNPNDRFSSCRELVNALDLAGRTPVSVPVPANIPPTQTQGPPQHLAATEAGPNAAPAQQADRPRNATDMLGQLEVASQAVATALGTSAFGGAVVEADPWGGDLLPAPGPCVDCPPPAESTDVSLAPTLLIGIGGTGGKVLQRLRRRIKDRGEPELEARIGFLLFDTDGRDIMRATHGEEGAPLAPDETLAMPLRRTQDYRNDTSRSLDWLSRRWLYNIPRSLQTEGLRPLGRLALVDHAAEAIAKIRSAIERLTEQESQLAAQAGKKPVAPRVVMVGSIAGGTASGSVVDVAYAARQVLDELNLTASPVQAVLAHSTNRSPQAQELAVVNSYAALSELAQFHRPGCSYPGAFGSGLKPRQGRALQQTYVVQLGDELSADDYHAACDRLAAALLLDVATAASGWLQGCRSADSQGETADEFHVRTLGVCQVGVGQDALVDLAAMKLCHATLERWTGIPKQSSERQSSRVIPVSMQGRSSIQDSQAAKDSQIDTIAATQAATLGLDLDRLMQLMHQQAAKEFEGNPDQCFRSIVHAFPADQNGVPLDRWLQSVMELFGTRYGTEGPPKISQLQLNLEDHARSAAVPFGAAARKWLESLVDHPAARLYGAQRATRWLQSHLKALAERTRETRMRLNEEWFSVEQQLIATVRPDPRNRNRPQPQSPENLLLQLCRLRLLELTAHTVGVFVQALQAHLLGAQDSMADLARDIQNLLNRYAVSDEELSPATDDEMGQVKAAVAGQLKLQEVDLAARLDESITAEVVAPGGGLRTMLQGGEKLTTLVERLETAARTAVLSRLDSLDFASQLFNPQVGTGASQQVASLIESAQPRLQKCGGNRRLLCVLPASSSLSDEAAMQAIRAARSVFQQPPALIRDAGSDVHFYFEMGQVPIAQVAATIIDHRPDFLECAERIHTRADVAWQPLLRLPS